MTETDGDVPTVTRTATVASASGLHARPAHLLVQAANAAGIPVTIGLPGGRSVDARSILGVMTLGATRGTTVVLSAAGPRASDVLDSLAALIETDLDAAAEAPG